MKNYKYEVIDCDSEAYPNKLKQIDNPPKKLYLAGDISLISTESVAIVGSRKFTKYGREISQIIAKELAKCSITVVSGMALGIDTFAHEASLKANGKTIAVIGTGINMVYPASNRGLMEEIYNKGLIISEYEPNFSGSKFTFPLRNRIISGISSKVVIVEAGAKSGALITANYAIEQGKDVYSVPGNINSYASIGTNKLIYDGANPLINIGDLISNLGIEYVKNDIKINDLSEEEMRIAKEVRESGVITADEIYKKTGYEMSKINSIITILEIKGIIRSYGGKIYYEI